MSNNTKAILDVVPRLRRHSRLLSGSQGLGDEYVRICLELVTTEPWHLEADELPVALFRAFHRVWESVNASFEPVRHEDVDLEERLVRGVGALPALQRRVLLLVVVEGFSYDQAARILDRDVGQIRELLAHARHELRTQVSVPVLIIEDEPIIAMDLSRIIDSMGHTVAAMASNEQAALREAERVQPGLVLADVQLRDDDSGISTTQKILQHFDVPVVFVTGFPERLMVGGRLEPAFVVAKPFDEDALKATIAQALSVYDFGTTAREHKKELLAKLSAITGEALPTRS